MKHLNIIFFIIISSVTGFAGTLKRHMPYLILPTVQSENETNISEKILPKSIAADESSESFVAKVVDNSLDYVWNASGIKNTSVGRVAHNLDKNLKAEMSLGGSPTDKSVIGHKFSLKLLASQALAKLEYKGWVKAVINYDAKSAKTEAEILENLSNNKDLIISHSATSSENKSQLSLRWNW